MNVSSASASPSSPRGPAGPLPARASPDPPLPILVCARPRWTGQIRPDPAKSEPARRDDEDTHGAPRRRGGSEGGSPAGQIARRARWGKGGTHGPGLPETLIGSLHRRHDTYLRGGRPALLPPCRPFVTSRRQRYPVRSLRSLGVGLADCNPREM